MPFNKHIVFLPTIKLFSKCLHSGMMTNCVCLIASKERSSIEKMSHGIVVICDDYDN